MKNLFFFILIIFLLPSIAYSENNDPFQSQTISGGAYFELGGRSDPDAIGGEIGIFGFTSKYTELRASFAFLASETSEDIFTGGNIGARFQMGNRILPFVGIGAFTGYSKENVKADDDMMDNDDDGEVDEDGEEKEVVDNVIGSIYPEAGIHFMPDNRTRITFAAKYHLTTEGRDNDFFVYSLGISILFSE